MIEFKVIKQGDFDRKLATINKNPAVVGKEGKKEIVRIVNSLRNAVIRDLRKPKTGRTYEWRGINPGEKPDSFIRLGGKVVPVKKRGVAHRSSAPGEPPAIDTGEMRNRLFIDVRTDEIEFGSLSEKPPYPLWLEVGTRNIAPRPWLEPVVKRFENKIEQRLADVISGRLGKDWRLR
jgi:hypothetical protein